MTAPTAYVIMPIAGQSLTACNQYAHVQGLSAESQAALEHHRQRVMAVKQLVAEAARTNFKLKYDGKPPADVKQQWKELIRDIEVMMLVYGYGYDDVVSTLSRMGIWFHSYKGDYESYNAPEFVPFTNSELANKIMDLRSQRVRETISQSPKTRNVSPLPRTVTCAELDASRLLPIMEHVQEPDCISSEGGSSSMGEEDEIVPLVPTSATTVAVC